MKSFNQFFVNILTFIQNNPGVTIIFMMAVLIGYMMKLLNTPDAVIKCPDGSSMVVDLPIDLKYRDRAELMELYTIPAMCGTNQ